jgi:transposase InsO family protein
MKYLNGDLEQLTQAEARKAAKTADQFEIDQAGILRFAATPSRSRGDTLRLVVPPAMRPDVLHMHHDDVQGGHQGVTRTYERIKSEYYWRGLFKDVERHVQECIDCVTSKGGPPNAGPSPGNVAPERPMQIVSMDFVLPLPESRQGNTALLLFQDMFTGYIMSKAMRDTSAQAVAEAYEEVVFRRFGASAELRHDRDPRFMSQVFQHFARMMGSRQLATLAYRPQANGQQERSVQSVIRAVRAYIEEPGQEDWEELAGRLMFALNTGVDATRRETPFYLMHG